MNNNLTKELEFNFINYAAAVNTDRAIPDATSGLKPVARRILYGAFDGGRTSNKPHVKCARIVGDVMGNLHPHGDSSIYGALVRLSQDWVMRYPLMDFHGNVGNIGGDGPAASRYTEARLAKISEEGMLKNLKKNVVDFIPNYDETTEEPITLPSIFPNLLCNPNTGIGVAMACNWLPHNLNDVANSIYEYMSGKDISVVYPDFPTGGVIINKNDMPAIMKTGHGSIKLRGKYEIKKNQIIFTEIPYGTTIEGLLEEIGSVSDEKIVEGISNVRDESTIKGVKIVIDCDRSHTPEEIVNKLFAKTNLQSSISYNQVALVNKVPTELNYEDCLKIYLEHNIKCLIREWNFDLKKATERLHIVEGLLIALEDINNVIELIKKSENSSAAKENLIKKYNLSEIQAKSILAMRLSSLAHMEKIELENEKKELLDFIDDLNYALSTPARQKEEVKVRLQSIVKKFGDKRRTEVTQINIKPELKEIAEVVPENVVVVLSQAGDIKKIPQSAFKIQRRGGKGVKTSDAVLETISTNTTDIIMFFTNKGKMYRSVVDNIPTGTNASKGCKVGTLIKLEPGEEVIKITSLNFKSDKKYILFFTKKGMVKKTHLEEYTKAKRNSGIAAIKLADKDSIANIEFCNDEDAVVITKNGMCIHFETKTISAVGRVAMGVKSIKLKENDEVLTGFAFFNENDKIAIISGNGYGKLCKIDEFPKQARGGVGIMCKYGEFKIIGAMEVDSNDALLLIGKPNSICISTNEIPTLSRLAQGNTLSKNTIEKCVRFDK